MSTPTSDGDPKPAVPETPPRPIQLKREVGLVGAVLLGLGSIVGTGVFVSIGLGAGIAGPAVVLAIVFAGLLAMCNAMSSAQLAAAHPVSGGTYEYGYKFLNPRLGFVAGSMFMLAKSASAATAALGVAGYVLIAFGVTEQLAMVIGALVAVVVMTAIVLAGIRRSNQINAVIVGLTLAVLALFIVVGLVAKGADFSPNFQPFFEPGAGGFSGGDVEKQNVILAMLYATALMFVAYTGYGRICTLGEEVHEPSKTIPKAVMITLAVSATLYVGVALVSVDTAGAGTYADFTKDVAAPLEAIARLFEIPYVDKVVAFGAITAMLGVLLNLLLGLSRVLLAMGRRRDVPPVFAKINAAGSTPIPAVIMTAIIIGGLACLGSVKTTWTFSAFTVLIYYGITNLCALRLAPDQRLYPRFFSYAGLVGCLGLAFFVPWRVWAIGLGLIVAALLWQIVARKMFGQSE